MRVLGSLLILVIPSWGAGAPIGPGETTISTGVRAIRVFTYKPKSFSAGPILFVFHGQKRNAATYRDYAIPLAEKMRAMVVVPWFEEESFPGSSYPQGRILRANGTLEPQKEWIFTICAGVIRTVLAREGNPRRPYYLLGHSAGAQFLARFTALEETGARRIVAANPGTYAFPRTDWDWPYGLGNLPLEWRGEKNLRRFLAAPFTVILGTADTNQATEAGNFPATPEANRQGVNRLERGRNFFECGQKIAEERQWEFGWKKVEIPGLGHDGNLMINDLATEKALRAGNKVP